MFGIINKAVPGYTDSCKCIEECVNGSVALADNLHRLITVMLKLALKANLRRCVVDFVFLIKLVADELIRSVNVDIFFSEQLHNLVCAYLPADIVAVMLDGAPKLRMHGLGKVIAEVVRHNKRRAALAGLAVYADYRFILPADIRWVNRQIGNLPVVAVVLFHVLLALVDSVLMRTRESGEHKLAGIRMAGADMHSRRALIDFLNLVDIMEIKLGVNALSIHIQRQSYYINIACAFAVAEKRALDSVRTRKNTELRSRHGSASVVMRMKADDRVLSVGQVAAEIFYLIRKEIRSAALDR